MAYITLDELKKILPEIIDGWIDWELIFNEIEQKCHIGTKRKGKKWKKYIEDDISELKYFRHNEYEVKVNGLTTKINQLNKEVEEMHRKFDEIRGKQINMQHSMDRMKNDISAAESKAKIAMIRTDVDYTKCSEAEKSDEDVIQEVYNRMVGRGATREELDTFRNLIQKYDVLEKKEIPIVKKMCKTCKHSEKVNGCEFSDICKEYSDWEAKDNG